MQAFKEDRYLRLTVCDTAYNCFIQFANKGFLVFLVESGSRLFTYSCFQLLPKLKCCFNNYRSLFLAVETLVDLVCVNKDINVMRAGCGFLVLFLEQYALNLRTHQSFLK